MTTIRISRDKMITALNEAVITREAAIKVYNAAHEQYEKEWKFFKKNLAAAAKNGKATVEYVEARCYSYGAQKASFTIRYTLPEGMTEPTQPTLEYPRHGDDEIETIKQNIRLLEMSDDQFIPASLYKSLSKFI